MRKVTEKLLFQTERSTKYMIVNSPGVMLPNIKDCEKQEMLQSCSLYNSTGNLKKKYQNSNFPNLSSTHNSTKSNLVVQC